MEEFTIEWIEDKFKKCERDVHSVRKWLIESKSIPDPLAMEVIFLFAKKIEDGERFGFRQDGLSELSLAILGECQKRIRDINIETGVKTLQALAGKPLLDKELYELTDVLLEMGEILYVKLDLMGDLKERKKKIKRNKSKIRHPFRSIKEFWIWLRIKR